MKKGDKVKMAPMWKYDSAEGVVIKVTKKYIVVKWEGINGEWHYTKEQSEKIKVISKKS